MTTPDVVAAALIDARSSLNPEDRWQLRPATIIVAGTGSVAGRFDGEGLNGAETVDIPMISLIGYVAIGARVMVMTVPPAGNYVISDLAASTAQSDVDNVSFTNNSTTYTNAGASVFLRHAFIVPASGLVMMHYGASLAVSVTGNGILVSVEIREGETVGAGAIVIAASDDNAAEVVNTAGNPDRQGVSYLFTGTPGASYNVELLHRVSGSIGTYDSRYLISDPK